MMVHLLRVLFLVVAMAITVSYAFQGAVLRQGPDFATGYLLIPTLGALGLVLVDIFWHRKRLQVLGGVFFGVMAGLVLAYAFSLVIDLMVGPKGLIVTIAEVAPADPGPAPLRRSPPEKPELPYADATTEQKQAYRRAMQDYDNLLEAHIVANANLPLEQTRHARAMKILDDYQFQVKTVQLAKLLLGAAAIFLCVTFVMQTKDEFRFVIPYVEFARQLKGSRPLLLDTSVIIDGRIADIADTQIFQAECLVPRFILTELQAIADSDEKLRRNRGRRGLDVLNRMQTSDKLDIKIVDPHVPEVDRAPDADAKLVALAEHLSGRIVTNDYNLNKIAQLRGVNVLNINDLANALKPVVLPGESMKVKIIKPGEEPGQGVGYLDDGTMIVAEQCRDYVGKDVAIAVTSVLQTSAGRMIFGRLDPDRTLAPRRDK